MYKIINDVSSSRVICVYNTQTNTSIPLDESNTDYAQFKKDILEGAELVDADGQVMDAIQFVKELP